MKIKVSEATNIQLDYLVAKCEGHSFVLGETEYELDGRTHQRRGCSWPRRYSADWTQGGPIIGREKIALRNWLETGWQADTWNFRFDEHHASGPTPLIAAMRCYVAIKLGEEVDIPEDLK